MNFHHYILVIIVSGLSSAFTSLCNEPTFDGDLVEQLAKGVAGHIDGGDGASKYFATLNPQVVAIVAEKLEASLKQEPSPAARDESIILQMPLKDQKHVRRECALIHLQAVAIYRMNLSDRQRAIALNSLYQGLHSGYSHSRLEAIYGIKISGEPSAAKKLLPLLNDPKEINRVIAAEALGAIGNTSIIPELKEIIDRRRQSLGAVADTDATLRHSLTSLAQLNASIRNSKKEAEQGAAANP